MFENISFPLYFAYNSIKNLKELKKEWKFNDIEFTIRYFLISKVPYFVREKPIFNLT